MKRTLAKAATYAATVAFLVCVEGLPYRRRWRPHPLDPDSISRAAKGAARTMQGRYR